MTVQSTIGENRISLLPTADWAVKPSRNEPRAEQHAEPEEQEC